MADDLELLQRGVEFYEHDKETSLEYFLQVNQGGLSLIQLDSYNFHIGCIYFSAGKSRNRQLAVEFFRRVIDNEFSLFPYKIRAFFYSGVCYAEGIDGVPFQPEIAYRYLIMALLSTTDLTLFRNISNYIMYVNGRVLCRSVSMPTDVDYDSGTDDDEPRIKRSRRG